MNNLTTQEPNWREHLNHHKKKWLLDDLLGKRVYAANGYYLGTVKNCGFEDVGGVAYLHSIVVNRERFRKVDLWKPIQKFIPKDGFKRRVLWKNIKRITKDKIIIRRWE